MLGLFLVLVVDAVAMWADVIINTAWTFGSGSPCIAALVLLLLLSLVNSRFGAAASPAASCSPSTASCWWAGR